MSTVQTADWSRLSNFEKNYMWRTKPSAVKHPTASDILASTWQTIFIFLLFLLYCFVIEGWMTSAESGSPFTIREIKCIWIDSIESCECAADEVMGSITRNKTQFSNSVGYNVGPKWGEHCRFGCASRISSADIMFMFAPGVHSIGPSLYDYKGFIVNWFVWCVFFSVKFWIFTDNSAFIFFRFPSRTRWSDCFWANYVRGENASPA